ncbi:2-hydroxyacid dehydrogenase [Amycolatopsis sp. WGS_07]|uniref:2-hydroxyacid dehydrogenase n=1 Tax=Amycolatopsis sp. WGS_07 TaxID=3076764 RepID=UPI003872B999
MTAPLVAFTCPLPEPAESLLAPHARIEVVPDGPDRIGRALALDPVVLVSQLTDRLDAERLATAGARLRAICQYSAGHDNVDLAAASRLGIAVTTTPDVLTDATADLAMTLLLALQRRVLDGDRITRAGEFPGWRPDFLLGQDLGGSVLGLAGFGRIAQAVARRAESFGMRVLYCRRPPAATAVPATGTSAEPVSWPELLRRADVVSLHVPLTAQTRHLIDAAALRAMKRNAVLVNTSRGAVVDEAALVTALHSGVIAGAGLDVYEHEPRLAPGLPGAPNTVLLPHVGSATEQTRAAMARICARNVLAVLAGSRPGNLVNPAASAAPERSVP